MIGPISFDSIPYGAYFLSTAGMEMYTEAIKYNSAVFNRLYYNKIRLPDGRSNIVYLLTPTFHTSVDMISGERFDIPSGYKRVFCPPYANGTFMGRRFRLNANALRKDRASELQSRTRMTLYPGRAITGNSENIIIPACDYYTEFAKIMAKTPVKRNYTEFFKELSKFLAEITPKKNPALKEGLNNARILIIDADNFAFKMDAKLDEAKLNPLYLLYLAFLRNRNLSSIDIDVDMLICSGSMFMKFNPSTCTAKEWNIFRNALFKIIRANLDDYTEGLEDEEKSELQTTSKDIKVSDAVAKAVEPYTKELSGSTKAVVQHAVETKVRANAAIAARKAKETAFAQQDVAREIAKKGTGSPSRFISPSTQKSPILAMATKPSEGKKFTLAKPTKGEPTPRQITLFDRISGYAPLAQKHGFVDDELYDGDDERPEEMDEPLEDEEDVEDIQDSAKEILVEDDEVKEEILEEIQNQTVPLTSKHAPINSKRDAKLREAQKKVVVQNETIEEILARDSSRVQIPEEDKSKVLHTSNKHMHKIRFANFDKVYIDELMMRDIVACFDFLKDLEYPFYVTDVEVKDSSDSLNFKDRWTVTLRDETNKRYTIRVDIPKFQNDRFMLIDGTRYIILKQNFYQPLVKDTPDTVIMTTNFNKVTISRKATRSLSTVERIFALMKKTADEKMFKGGDSSKANMRYLSSLEYDELSRRLFMYKSGNCKICFSRDYIRSNWTEPTGRHDDEFFIGTEGGNPIFINEDTGLDRSGRTIADIIEAHLPQNYLEIYSSVKGPKQSMYAEGILAGEDLPIITTLCVWVGLRKALDLMKIGWKFSSDVKRVPKPNSAKKYIRFANGVLEYDAKTFAELIMNGMAQMHPEKFAFEDFESEAGYGDYVYSKFGTYNGITEIRSFNEFLIDPITKQVCQDLGLPNTAPELLIHAIKLLADNAYVSKANDTSYRVRSIEMIPAILYGCLARQYKLHIKSARKYPMTLKENCVIQQLRMEKTVEAYSTLNPVQEMSRVSTISTKGYKGSNSEHSYDEEKRSYDPTAIGKLAMSSDPNAGVGINRQLTVEPTIANARGYRDPVDDINSLEDVNVFSPVEMMTPGTVRGDDAIRTSIANKQSGHIMPTRDAVPSLVSNGFDEAVQFYLSDDFVINAEEDGKVISVDDKTGFVVVQYKSGKTKAINTKPEIVKNSGGGFFLSNQLTVVHTKVGETFKKDEPLAYHPKYFRYSKMNGLRFTLGPIAKVAFLATYNTYEDAGICTESFAEKMATHVVYRETGMFRRNNNILWMVKVGDHVNIGDPLIKFNVSVENDELSKYLSKLNDENAELLENESKSDVKAGHAGKIVDIKVYSLLDPKMLSESLGKVVQSYFDIGISKKEFLEKFDDSAGTMKAGYLLTDSTEPIKNRWNAIKGIKGIDVLIEIYIEHDDVLGIGDKVAMYGPNKQIISEVCPHGFEPYTESEPDEEISMVVAPGSVARRMTISSLPITGAGKICVGLKKEIAKMIKFSK